MLQEPGRKAGGARERKGDGWKSEGTNTSRAMAPERVLILIAMVACVATPAVAVANEAASCGDARYLVEPVEPVAELAAIVVDEGRITLEGPCGVGTGQFVAAGTSPRLRGRLPRCSGRRARVRVAARIAADCEIMEGMLRRRRGRPRREAFRATRSRCGDGRVDLGAGEQCDLASPCPADVSCRDDCTCEPTGTPTTTSTMSPASTTTSFPVAVCGNDRLDPGEACDGADLERASCASLGFPGGTLACAPGCRSFDTRDCFLCGNGQREGAEECDTPDLDGATCNAPGETGGQVSCTTACRLDRRTCFFCGNERVDPGEECDDGNAALGDGCRPDCRTECGNGTVERNEECDDGSRTAGDGCSAQCALEQPFGGGGRRQDCAVTWGVAGGEARQRQECRDGDPGCDRGSTAGECAFLVFYCFNVAEIVIGGPPVCTPTDIARVGLRGSTVSGPHALSPADVDAFLGAMTATLARGGASVSRGGAALQPSPPVTARHLCGATTLHVPLRGTPDTESPARELATEVADSVGAIDRDSLSFVCEP